MNRLALEPTHPLQKIGILTVVFSLLLPVYASPVRAYEVAPVPDGGTLEGSIRFKGDPPANQSHQVVNNPDFCGSSVQEETFLVNPKNRGFKNVVISIEGVQKGKGPDNPMILIQNKNCHFFPHIMTGMAGDTYEVRNSDPVLHNTHLYLEENSILNVAMPAGGKNIRKTIGQPGIIKVKCDAHKFMQGWVVISDSPYSAVSDDEGRFSIGDIPAGKYKVRVWHEALPSVEREITISKGKKSELTVEMEMK